MGGGDGWGGCEGGEKGWERGAGDGEWRWGGDCGLVGTWVGLEGLSRGGVNGEGSLLGAFAGVFATERYPGARWLFGWVVPRFWDRLVDGRGVFRRGLDIEVLSAWGGPRWDEDKVGWWGLGMY